MSQFEINMCAFNNLISLKIGRQ